MQVFLRRLAAVAFLFLVAIAPAQAVTIERVHSPGGIEAWLVRDATVPLISMRFAFRGGSRLEPAGREGLGNLVSGLLDEGAGPYDSQAFQRAMEDISMQMSFGASRDNFRGSLRVLNEFRDRGIDLLALALSQPRFEDEPVARIRAGTIASLRRQSEDPQRIAGIEFFKTVFPDHVYGRPSQGTIESVTAITPADMRAFLARQLVRDRLFVGVVGDIAPEALGPLLDRAFGALPARGPAEAVPEAQVQGAGKVVVVRKKIPQSVVLLGGQGIKRNDPDFYAAFVMNYVLGGGGFSSRLSEEVRERRGLAYAVYSYLSALDRAALVMGSVATQNLRVKESLDLIRAEWGRMAEGGATEEELKDAKTYINGSFPLRLDSTGAVADLLVDIQLDDLGIDYLDKRADYINAVTRADVQRVAARLLKPDQLTVVIVGDPAGVESTP
ncbi:MAG: M16 family metallopeptidase [Rhodospirillales bacterium]